MKTQKNLLVALLSLLIISFSVGCDGNNPAEEQGQGDIYFGMSLSKVLQAGYNITAVKVTITKGSYSDSMSLAISGDTATGTFTALAIGTYSIDVRIYDGTTLIGTGSGSGEVLSSQTSNAQINVTLYSGGLNVVVHWTILNGTFTDSRDGHVYNTIQIGTQVWMAENLNYRPTSGNSWYYNNDSITYSATYGRLYDWATALTVAPTGWHLPTDSEWTVMTTFLGGDSVAGGKLREADTLHWANPNTGATNEAGFTGLPGGYRVSGGTFTSIRVYGYWWCSTQSGTTVSWDRAMYYNDRKVYRGDDNKTHAFSIRCVKD